MIPTQSLSSSGPKRFNSGARLYTDPFAEFQQTKQESLRSAPSVSVLPLLPSGGIDESPFPVGESAFPIEGDNAASPVGDEGSAGDVLLHERYQVIEERGGEVVYQQETDIVYNEGFTHAEQHEYFTDQPTELEDQQFDREDDFGVASTDQATAGSTVNENDISRLYASESTTTDDQRLLEATVPDLGGTSEWQTTRPVLPPVRVTSPMSRTPLGPQGTELSAIDPVEETGLSGYSYLNRGVGETPLVTQISIPRKESRDEWFGENAGEDQEERTTPLQQTSSVEASLLGHPVAGGTKASTNLPPLLEFTETLTYLKSQTSPTSQDAIISVQRVINQCVDLSIVKEDPTVRTLFCEAMEAVSFNEGPLRNAAKDAVNVLVECLEESSIVGESEEDRTTATAALGALWNLTFTNSSGDQLDVELIASTKRAMLSFPDDGDVQTNASGLLINLATDRQGQRQVLNLGCIDALVNSVKAHQDNVSLIEHTCQLLAMISARKDLRSQLPPKYSATVLDIASRIHDPSVQRWYNWLKSLNKV